MTGGSDRTRWNDVLGGLWRSKLGLLGVVTTTISAALILVAIATELFFGGLGAYQGLVAYMLLPALFLGGLALMPLGAWLVRRAGRRRGEEVKGFKLVIDLGQPKQRRFVLFVIGMTVVNGALIVALSYNGYHYTESTAFCGTLCHSVMEPEYTAYQRSPHARVDCVECHIGDGASWFVKAKLSGLRQVWGVLVGDFHRPIPTPIHNLRPARETCEQCHWPQVFHGNRPKVFTRVGEDGDVNDPEITAVMLHVGGHEAKTGAYSGIHWHVSRDTTVEYRASDDKREQIREVRVRRADGSRTTFTRESAPPVPAETVWRVMECVDCHNRPTHIYDLPEEAVDRQLLLGRVDASLPGLRGVALEAVQAEYPSRAAARAGIASALLRFYEQQHADVFVAKRAEIEAAAALFYDEVYAVNIYPALKIKWGTYKSHLGHRDDSGCFRCHNDEHADPDGKVISQDCDTCHEVIVEEEKLSEIDESVKAFLF